MALFALSDPHLGFAVNKPMSVFGPAWQDHEVQLAARWQQTVAPDDWVILPGDLSWAMSLEEALPDLRFLDRLPGRKILSRGNHDYWWSTLARMKRFCAEHALDSLQFLRNDCQIVDDGRWLVCGTRGWISPGDTGFGAEDEVVYARETGRLRLSLEDAEKKRVLAPDARLLVCMHYPPFGRNGRMTEHLRLIEEAGADLCIYGHIHGAQAESLPSSPGQVPCLLVSADWLDFQPLRLDCRQDG